MTNVRSVITAIFRTALCKCYPSFNTTRAIIQTSGAERFGDYKCVAAMPLANVSNNYLNKFDFLKMYMYAVLIINKP